MLFFIVNKKKDAFVKRLMLKVKRRSLNTMRKQMKSLRHAFFYIGILNSFCTSTFADMDVVLLNYEISIRPSCEISVQRHTHDSEGFSLNFRSFEERAPGVFFPTNARIDAAELELLLKDPKVSFVVLDNRDEYTFGGDQKIQTNKEFIQDWYKHAKLAIGENNIHKLVWLPQQKVVDDLMSRMSFVPEAWLLKMDRYYALYGSGGRE